MFEYFLVSFFLGADGAAEAGDGVGTTTADARRFFGSGFGVSESFVAVVLGVEGGWRVCWGAVM